MKNKCFSILSLWSSHEIRADIIFRHNGGFAHNSPNIKAWYGLRVSVNIAKSVMDPKTTNWSLCIAIGLKLYYHYRPAWPTQTLIGCFFFLCCHGVNILKVVPFIEPNCKWYSVYLPVFVIKCPMLTVKQNFGQDNHLISIFNHYVWQWYTVE